MTEEQPDTDDETTLPSDALDWSIQFEKHYREAFQFACAKLSNNSSTEEFQKAAAQAFVSTLRESGIKDTKLVEFIGQAIWIPAQVNLDWTDEKNNRRTELIDKMFQHTISLEERFELGALTRTMRTAFDTEENIPLSGAKKLYSELLEMDDDD